MNTPQRTAKREALEHDILTEALDAFRRVTHLAVEELGRQPAKRRPMADARIRILGFMEPLDFWPVIQASLHEAALGRIALQFTLQPGRRSILVTRYVPSRLAIKMRDLRIPFIDTAGNAFLDAPPVFIFTQGNRPASLLRERGESGMLGAAGAKVVFALLCKNELVRATYRQIAEMADVALGSTAHVLDDLKRRGFLLEPKGQQRRLVRKRELADLWTSAYAQRLRGKSLLGRYTPDDPGFWSTADLSPYNAQWGGEVAANKLTHYLKPEVITIYAQRPVQQLVLNFKLRKEQRGGVEIRERFWKFTLDREAETVVPPLLVYADLLATADPRNVEAAKMIYDSIVQRYFGKD